MPVVIPHVDDIASSHSANAALGELVDAGLVASASIIVPGGWFPDAAELARRRPELDLGVHLTLTSESQAFRWRPLSTNSVDSGLIDPAGYFWPDVPSVRRHARPDAVEAELRAQIEAAWEAGVGVTHLDHHMGAALAPEFVEGTVSVARDFDLPVLFPRDLPGYVGALNMGEVSLAPLEEARRELAAHGLAAGDVFVMGLSYMEEPCREVFERIFTSLGPGLTFLSLHCSKPGDIEAVHPADAAWRIAEYELFLDSGFVEWVAGLELAVRSFGDLEA